VRSPRAAFAVSSGLLALAVATTAAGQPPLGGDALIEHGIQLREQGHDDQALVEFRRAYAVTPSPRARAQMGLAEQALGQWVLAEQHLREALAAESDPWIAGRRSILATAAAAVARHLGSLAVSGAGPANARVFLDGVDVGPLPLTSPVRVETGSRLLEVRAQGFYPVIRTIEITAGATARETVTLRPSLGETDASVVSGPPPTPVAPADEGPRLPGSFHASFLTGGPPAGPWTLRDSKDGALCTLPCAYWIDPKKKYVLARASLLRDEHELRLAVPDAAFREGIEVREQIKGPTGSFVGGIAITATGAVALGAGIILLATAPSTSPATIESGQTSGYYIDELGVVAIIGGTLALAGGIVVTVLSEPWRVDARATNTASLSLTPRGVELAHGDARAWITPFGVAGVF
jgi:hypothetical protein